MAMTLETDDEFEAAVTGLVDAEGGSRDDVVRRAVLERFGNLGHGAALSEKQRETSAKWTDELNRLGTV